jgi:hypothetical protein
MRLVKTPLPSWLAGCYSNEHEPDLGAYDCGPRIGFMCPELEEKRMKTYSHRRKLVYDLMTAASAPRLSVRRDRKVDRDDETGRPYQYEILTVQIGPGREVGPFVDEDALSDFCCRVAKLRRRHTVLA